MVLKGYIICNPYCAFAYVYRSLQQCFLRGGGGKRGGRGKEEKEKKKEKEKGRKKEKKKDGVPTVVQWVRNLTAMA